jgi:hypothetical protein
MDLGAGWDSSHGFKIVPNLNEFRYLGDSPAELEAEDELAPCDNLRVDKEAGQGDAADSHSRVQL